MLKFYRTSNKRLGKKHPPILGKEMTSTGFEKPIPWKPVLRERFDKLQQKVSLAVQSMSVEWLLIKNGEYCPYHKRLGEQILDFDLGSVGYRVKKSVTRIPLWARSMHVEWIFIRKCLILPLPLEVRRTDTRHLSQRDGQGVKKA